MFYFIFVDIHWTEQWNRCLYHTYQRTRKLHLFHLQPVTSTSSTAGASAIKTFMVVNYLFVWLFVGFTSDHQTIWDPVFTSKKQKNDIESSRDIDWITLTNEHQNYIELIHIDYNHIEDTAMCDSHRYDSYRYWHYSNWLTQIDTTVSTGKEHF